jgi:Zn-dependent peptidase ImmA (M78 family)
LIKNNMPKVNPKILRWARETAGLTPEEAVKKLALKEARGVSAVDRLAALEMGEDMPSRPMLVNMAKKYRRPLLTFYLSAPPKTGDRGQDFRTLPEGKTFADEALLDALIRDIQARQSMVRSVLEDEDEASPLPFIGSMKITDGAPAVLASIRETLLFSLSEFRSQANAEKAFALLREAAEAAGIFVILRGDLGNYHTNIDLHTFRGFALADPIAPFVIINSQDAKNARAFTLLHELAHLWLGQTGVTGVSGEDAELSIERFCNGIAGEFLLPMAEIRALQIDTTSDMETLEHQISGYASKYNVSSSMIAYKLYKADSIDEDSWKQLKTMFRDKWLESQRREKERRKGKKGPSANKVDAHRLGSGLIRLVVRMMDAGALSTTKAGKVLGIKGQRIPALLEATGHGGFHRLA